MKTFEDWRPPIVEMVVTKEQLKKVDPEGLFPYFLPEVAATEQEVDVAERALGISLDEDHRTFLKFANGWKCFIQEITLLGAGDLGSGELWESAKSALRVSPETLEANAWSIDDLIPIGASLAQADIFLMHVENGAVAPQVIWVAEGERIDTYDSFGQFFVSMIEYTRRRVRKMVDEQTA